MNISSAGDVIDRLFSGVIVGSGCVFSYFTWKFTGSVSRFCTEIQATDFNVFSQYFSLLNVSLLNSCNRISHACSPITRFCNLSSSYVFEQLAPDAIKDAAANSCHQWIYYANATEVFCKGMSDVSFAAFEQLASFDAKQQVLDTCAIVESKQMLLLIPLFITGSITAYYAFTFFSHFLEEKRPSKAVIK